ncbi:unnamed protein product, partial [Meganyctiphanes norvegica]
MRRLFLALLVLLGPYQALASQNATSPLQLLRQQTLGNQTGLQRNLRTTTRICPDGYVEIESQCFFMANERMNWDNAKKRCEGLSSQLASPEFPMALRDFVINNFPKLSFWIGGRYNENSDVWQWLSGAPFSISFPWGINDRGEQQDKGEYQHCMILRYFPIQDEQEYVDNRCEKMNYFICEKL